MAIRLSDEHARAVGLIVPAKPNKYQAKRTEYGGVMYDSKLEALYAANLDNMARAKMIAWWLRQVWIPLGPDFGSRVDYVVGALKTYPYHKELHVHGVEIKGVETDRFRRVRKLWPKYGPFPLHIIKRGNVEILEGR